MFYICLFFLVSVQSLPAEEASPAEKTQTECEGLRMGFNNAKYGLSVFFPGKSPLKCAYLENGEEIYYVNATEGTHNVVYQFADHGFGLEGLEAFKEEYLNSVKKAFHEKNPLAKCHTVLDEKMDDGSIRVILDSVGSEGSRSLFVGDFRYVAGKIYVASEIIELPESETGEALGLFNDAFFKSFEMQTN